MNIPQTNRQPVELSDQETANLLAKRHPQDVTDYFATDPNPDIRNLGRLSLRRNDINDLFALGDLCANRSLTDDGRLLVFYVGKTVIAYQKALRLADDDLDLALARRAIRNYVDWIVEQARASHSRRNIAVALWALAENEDSTETLRSEDNGLIQDLLDSYLEESPTKLVKATPDETSNGEDFTDISQLDNLSDSYFSDILEMPHVGSNRTTEDLTVVALPDFSETVNDLSQTVADMDELPSMGLSNTEFMSLSDTHLEQTALNSMASVERDPSYASRMLTEMPAARLPHDDDDEFAPGDWISNRYEVSDVKRGGMGVVYLGYDRDKKEPVAIKTFQSRFLDNERAVSRFNHEATTWIMLEKHRYIVQARRVETIAGRPHIILEHISGPEGMGSDLRSWIDRKRLDLPQSMEFGLHIALGMQHASQRVPGLVHRDLKPANILVTHDAIAKITDFGLVRSLEFTDVPLPGNDSDSDPNPRQNPSNRLTRSGAIVGTAPYMSPEQVEAKEVDLRADIYAFGCILYEMLTGQQIFKEKKFNAWKQAHLHQKPAFDAQFERELPMRLQALVMACLEKSPDNRPSNWGAIVDELAVIYEEVTGQKATLEITGPEMQLHELIDKGYSLTELHRMDEALAAYDRAIALQPDSALAWARKGRALRLMTRYDEAIACYDTAIEYFPRYGFAWRGKGLVLERMGRNEEALAAYQQATSIKPNEVWNWYNQADVMQNMSRYAEAVPLLNHALEIDPQHPNSWAKLGQVYRLMGKQEDAVYAYEKAIDLEPEYAWAHNGKGLALKTLNRYSDALVSFRRATQYQPNDVWHWYNLTEMLVELGQYNDALSPATQATRTDPTHAFSWAKLGQVMRHLNQNVDALDAYDHAIQIQPDYSWAINGKGIVLERMGRLEDALTCYNRAAEIQDDYIWHCWYNQGNVLALMGRYQEALPILQKVTQVMPAHAQSWARMGNALRNLKQPEDALKALQQATLLDPKYTWAWNETGITLEQLGRLDDALSAYQRAGNTAPKDPFYLTQQADILIQQGDNQQALDLLTQSLKLDPRNARMWA
ncbi:MAG: tetratricopeptide repeat protein, partial [Anaerolineae bacterium]|nr:tetratricopeptide repeat protein [Anaerolineae bacterium]